MITRRKWVYGGIDLRAISLYALAFLMCIMAGRLVSVSGPKVSLLFISALAGIVLVLQPVILLWLTTLMTLLVAGTVIYFTKGLNIAWGGYGLAVMLIGSTILVAFGESIRANASPLRRAPSSHVPADDGFLSIAIALTVFFAIAIVGITLNQPPVWQIVAASKSYFFYVGVWTVLAFARFNEDTVKNWLKGLLLIGLIQWPVAVYQYLFVRAARVAGGESAGAADSVVGTFGGSPDSGGLTAVLAFFLVISFTMCVAFYRQKMFNGRQFSLFGLLLVMPLLLMEVKVIFFYLPVAMFFLFKDYIYKRPVMFFGGGLTVVALLLGLLMAYQTFHWSARSDDMEDNVIASFTYSFSSDMAQRMRDRGELTRRSAIEFWIAENTRGDYMRTLIGHGLGATRYTEYSQGTIAKKYYPLNTTLTGLSIFLWEVGILGVMAFFFLIFCAYRTAGQVVKIPELAEWQRSLALGLQATAPLFVMSLGYRSDIPLAAPMMLIFMGHLGLISWLRYQGRVYAGR